MDKIPYGGRFPAATQVLISEGLMRRPKQTFVSKKAYDKVDIVYNLDWTPTEFINNTNELLNAAEAEANRYKDKYPGVKFTGRITIAFKGAREDSFIRSYGMHSNSDPAVFVWGPGYDVPQHDLNKNINIITKLIRKYQQEDKEGKQVPFRVGNLVISVISVGG